MLIKYNHRCAFCNARGDDILQAHHIVRRKHKVTRYMPLNGIPLCHKCHNLAHTKAGEQKIQKILGTSYQSLVKLEQIIYKQHLSDHGITDREHMAKVAAELKKAIS